MKSMILALATCLLWTGGEATAQHKSHGQRQWQRPVPHHHHYHWHRRPHGIYLGAPLWWYYQQAMVQYQYQYYWYWQNLPPVQQPPPAQAAHHTIDSTCLERVPEKQVKKEILRDYKVTLLRPIINQRHTWRMSIESTLTKDKLMNELRKLPKIGKVE